MDTRIYYLLVVIAAFACIAVRVSRGDKADADAAALADAPTDAAAEQDRQFASIDRDWY